MRIERSQSGDAESIGWTILRRTSRKYLYENEPLFRFARRARADIRKAHAIHHPLPGDDGLTHSHLHL